MPSLQYQDLFVQNICKHFVTQNDHNSYSDKMTITQINTGNSSVPGIIFFQ